MLGLSKEQREAETGANDAVAVPQEDAARVASAKRESSVLMSYVRGFFAIEHV